MSNIVKLMFVSGDNNHNKFYDIYTEGSNIRVEYGRVGATPQTCTYHASKKDSLIRSKLNKGYQDITHLFSESATSSKVDFLDISDRFIADLINKLMSYTKTNVSNNYNVSADKVTEKQIKEVQSLLNDLIIVKSNREANIILNDIYKSLPRKMKKVSDHLLNVDADFTYGKIEELVSNEQDLLDSMAQQVKQVELFDNNTDSKQTLLDAMGIEIFNVRKDQEDMIKNKLGSIQDKFVRGYRVENKKTQERFKKYVANKENKKTELLFHGTRNPSVLPIMQQGLLIRPSNAVYTGSMFDDGVYAADKAIKSYGYTSGKNSIWAKGTSNEAYMFLFEFHLGKQYVIERWESWMTKISTSTKFKGYDSVFAKGGFDLKNNEYVIYNSNACTPKYLIELRG